MSYRDDRDALRDRAETLERELDAARAEIERLRGAPPDEPLPSPPRPRPSGVRLAAGAVIALLAIAAFVPFPVPLRAGIASAALGSAAVLWAIVRSIELARPHEALLLYGQKLRIVRGRALRIPVLEQAARLDLAVFRVRFQVERASVRGGSVVDLDVVAHARTQPNEKATARLLGLDAKQRADVVATALDGILRETAAELTLEELDQDREKTAARVLASAEESLAAMGVSMLALFVLEVTPR